MGCVQADGQVQASTQLQAQGKIKQEQQVKAQGKAQLSGQKQSQDNKQSSGKVQPNGKIEYTNDLVRTPSQREADEDYGILETRKQRLTIDWDKKHAKYFQHYYYSVEINYEERTLRKKDTTLEGNFNEQAGVFKVDVNGSYVHTVKEDYKQVSSENRQVKGFLNFTLTENGVKVEEVKLNERGKEFETYFKNPIWFTKM